jgi:hypothetical protein
MDDPPTATALTALAAQADRDPTSNAALAVIVADRRAALNILLVPSGHHANADDFARLCGPVLFQRYIAREVATDQLIQSIVADWQAPSPRTFRFGEATA